jgi:hypothetical protein
MAKGVLSEIKEDAAANWLALADVEAAIPAMKAKGVSAVARGEQRSKVTGGGFIGAYRLAEGDPEVMGELLATPNQSWAKRRMDFVSRHMAQLINRGEALYDSKGNPKGRHLALIAWAYTPDPEGFAAWLRRTRKNGALGRKRALGRRNGSPWNPWKKVNRPGSEVQTLLFDRSKWKLTEARDWLKKHGFTGLGVDAKPHNLRFRQREPSEFHPNTFRTIPFGSDSGIQAVVGIPYETA